MKKTIEVFIAILLSASIFIGASYFNSFQHFYIGLVAYLCFYFLSGIIIGNYYNARRYLYPFIFVTGGFIITALWKRNFSGLDVYLISAFIIAAFALGFYFKRLALSRKIIFGLAATAAYFLVSFWVYPKQNLKIIQSGNSELIGKNINIFFREVSWLNVSKDTVPTNILDGKVCLIEMYFQNCGPCRIKDPVLKQLEQHYAGDNRMKVIYLQNGAIDDFDVYSKRDDVVHSRLTRFYDVNGAFCKNVKSEGYPFELIVDKDGIIRHVSLGYANEINKMYYKETLDKINLLINE